jgi:hypothetical protein
MHLELERAGGVLSLLYAAGERPSADDVARLLDEPAASSGQPARISHRPEDEAGWLELLANGLTFDLSGLAPAAPTLPQPAKHLFGLPIEAHRWSLESVSLAAGPHLTPGSALLPVVRSMCGLAVRLASLENVRAIGWQPAGSWIEPTYFARIIGGWLAGGAFPALGLTALDRTADGAIESNGLAFFTGQELRMEAREGEPASATGKLAVRMVDRLIQEGRIRQPISMAGPDGESLLAEPSANGEVVRIWRGA